MISLHRLHSEISMVKQCECQREEYLEQLRDALAELQIKVALKALAV